MIKAEVIAIGDELTSGQRLDTNSQWLAERLGELGIRTVYHTTVADDLAANIAVFRTACERVEIVVATGGLGPTADDLTRDALAALADVPLVCDAGALAHLESMFARRQRPMPERNRVQAFSPKGSRIIPNANGTAPGIDLDVPRGVRAARVFALPGVPAEMKPMWNESVAPALRAITGGGLTLVHKRLKCFGVGESDLEAMLPDLIRRGREPLVGITVHQATITLRITASGAHAEACAAQMEPTLKTMRACLGDLVFGEDDDELEHAVVKLLAARAQTVATLEYGTGGQIANWLSLADPTGTVFRGGRIAPFSHTVSVETLAQQAAELRQEAGVDFVLASGPFPDLQAASNSATPQFFHGVAGNQLWEHRVGPFVGSLGLLRDRSAKQTLNLLRQLLRKLPA